MLPRLSTLSFGASTAPADSEPLDNFQAAQAIWTPNSGDYALDSLRSSSRSSRATRLAVHGIRLASSTPLRALLAVAGETWVFSEKVRSDEHVVAKETLKRWTNTINDTSIADEEQQARTALEEALSVLRLATDTNTVDANSALAPGAELVLFYASLVLWATVAAAPVSRTPFNLTPPIHPLHHQHQNADDAVRAVCAFLAEEAASSVDTIDTLLQTWREGAEAVLHWACEALSGSEAPGELIGGCVRVTEGVRRKGWAAAWF